MRNFSCTLGWLALWSTSVGAATLYTWRDPHGVPHYSNVPVTRQRATPFDDVAPVATESGTPAPAVVDGPPSDGGDETALPTPAAIAPNPTALSDADRAAFSDRVSLKRQGLERAYRANRRRLADLQQQLARLSRTRVQHAALGTHAGTVVSDEEQPLLAQKTTIEREVDATRGAYDALAAEVTQRLGALPEWWITLR